MALPSHPAPVDSPASEAHSVHTIGCVSYLNARPLIHGIEHHSAVRVHSTVPSMLLDKLLAGHVDVALCPVIDYYRANQPLTILPVGAIGCDGPAMTVRLFSRVPIPTITTVHCDRDSHTSVALLQIVLSQSYRLTPRIEPLSGKPTTDNQDIAQGYESVLLIGDKVITERPTRIMYPYQLDLGTAWQNLTGLPFIFAAWMTTPGMKLGSIPDTLRKQRQANATTLGDIADKYSPIHRWPAAAARKYLMRIMKYDFDDNSRHAVQRFAELAHETGQIGKPKPINTST